MKSKLCGERSQPSTCSRALPSDVGHVSLVVRTYVCALSYMPEGLANWSLGCLGWGRGADGWGQAPSCTWHLRPPQAFKVTVGSGNVQTLWFSCWERNLAQGSHCPQTMGLAMTHEGSGPKLVRPNPSQPSPTF